MFIKIPKLLRLLTPGIIWEVDCHCKQVYLTFDDGPTPGITEFILETLAKYDAKATFFCLGKNAELYPHLIEKILAEGHRIGNHTPNHLKGWQVCSKDYMADIERANKIFKTNLFRPPYGRVGFKQAIRLLKQYKMVLWTVISQDYSKKFTPEEVLRKVTGHIRPGYIIVFHDSVKAYDNMSYALPRALEYIYKKGYTCHVLP